jgi:biopolymer transport protein ExbD
MLRKTRAAVAEQDENEINLTPMLDVVFIMLIFFIVTATFIKEAGIDVDRPVALTRDQMADAAILVAISPGDEIWIDKEQTDPKDVRTVLEKMHAENPKGSLVIQADSESTNEALVVVMEAAKQAGIANVAVSAVED